MKIMIFYFFLRDGGVEKNLVRLANHLAASDRHQVRFAAMDLKGHFLSELRPTIERTDFSLKPFRLWDHLKCIFLLAAEIRRQKPDVLLTGMTAANITVLLANCLSFRWWRTRVVISEHGPTLLWLKNRKSHPVLILLLRVGIGIWYRFADRIIVVSDFLTGDLCRIAHISRKRIQRIYNPVIDEDLLQKAEREIHHPWLDQKTGPVVLGVGRLASEKNFPLLLNAFAAARKQYPSLRLVILGNGSEQGHLEQAVVDLTLGDAVSMPGFQDNPPGYMKRADMLVLSSDYEGLPTVLIEALACGCPVVATNCPGGVSEILGNGQYGTLVPIGDVQAMAAAIIECLQHPDAAAKRTENFQRHKMQDFLTDIVMRQYMDLFESLT